MEAFAQSRFRPADMTTEKQTYTYATAGGLQLEADVYPPGADAAPPIILWLHGGALIMGHRGDIRPDQLRRYRDAGYCVVSIDYRLAPETKLPAILDDLRAASGWIRDRAGSLFPGDPEQLAVIGHSAGGYLTLMAGLLLDPRPRALVAFYGYGDIAGPWYSRPDPFYLTQPAVSEDEARSAIGTRPLSGTPGPHDRDMFYLYCRQQGLWPREVVGLDPDEERDAFRPFCPVLNITADYPPTLLLHGDRDTDVPYQQSVMMAERLREAGVAHDFITIRGGDHGFDAEDSPAVSEAFRSVLGFLGQHV
jgi:acetyl esterase/lipase